MMTCRNCKKEWNYEDAGVVCPFCRTRNDPGAEEAAALYHKGVCCEQDRKFAEAQKRYRIAAEAGLPAAEEAYARCLEEGIGGRPDPSRAVAFYRMAAEHGSARAAYRIYRCLAANSRLPEQHGSADFWLRVAVALGDSDAIVCSAFQDGISDEERLYRLHHAAMTGSAKAIRRLAHCYRVGLGTIRSIPAALWYYAAAPHKFAFFFRLIYRRYTPEKPPQPILPDMAERLLALGEEALGYGLFALAYRLFLLAAERDCLRAKCRLADCYADGIGVAANRRQAIEWYTLAEQDGSIEAAAVLGRLYSDSDPAAAREHYRRAAESGVPEYCHRYGEFLLTKGRSPDLLTAARCFRTAAEAGYMPAKERLEEIEGRLNETYERAVAESRAGNVMEAFALYRSAGELGHADALCNYGYCLQKGIGCTVDLRAAADAYRRAVEAGSEAARLNLALCSLGGLGTRRDFRRAEALLRSVSASYTAEAERLLAQMQAQRQRKRAARLYAAATVVYRRGDVAGALELRLKAARMGSARAAYAIGCHFEFGDGVATDRERANRFYESAAAAGFSGSRARLKSGYLKQKRLLLGK